MVRTKRSAKAFRLGERAGSRTGVTPAAASVSRTASVKSGSRSLDEKPPTAEKAVLGIGGVARQLGDPRPIRVGRDAGDLNPARGQLDQHEDREPGQATRQPHLHGEDIGGGHNVPVRGEKLAPRRALRTFGRGLEAVFSEDRGDGAAGDVVPEIAQGAADSGVAPVSILGRHPHNQLPDLCHDPRAARPAAVAAVVFPRDEATMPGEQGIGGDQRLKLTERAATESLGLCRHAPPLPVRETEPACRDVFPQHTIFFLEIVDDVALLLVDPAGHGDDEELAAPAETDTYRPSVAEVSLTSPVSAPNSVQTDTALESAC